VGVTQTFIVSATGSPTPSLKTAGTLPTGITFTDNGNGTATFSGTPANGSAGAYGITITAHNTAAPDATQSFALVVVQATAGVVYPVKGSANGRYLVDQNEVPFLLAGDAPQSLIGNLSESDAATYFSARQAQGFDAAWINLLCVPAEGCPNGPSTFDGIPPFLTPGDFSTPNPAYFQRADSMINLAAKYGITVFLDPVETGGWLTAIENNGPTKDTNYGTFIGNRYKTFPNIVWLNGNDFQTWNTDATANADVFAVAQAIKAADPGHIQTIELNFNVSGSLDDALFAPVLGLDAAYTYFPTYAEVLNQYNVQTLPNILPVFMVESTYEFESSAGNVGDAETVRREGYWTMLSGATGELYGNGCIWPFLTSAISGRCPGAWQNELQTPGAVQLSYLKSFFAPRQWYNLVPDQNHLFVTSGYGTFSASGTIASNDYLTAAVTPDGSLGVLYMPTSRTITVNMSVFSAPVTVRWFDPSNGAYSAAAGSPFVNTGTQMFTPSGNDSDGNGDWVLVFEVNPVSKNGVRSNRRRLAARTKKTFGVLSVSSLATQ
jgi:hypothetical protein